MIRVNKVSRNLKLKLQPAIALKHLLKIPRDLNYCFSSINGHGKAPVSLSLELYNAGNCKYLTAGMNDLSALHGSDVFWGALGNLS